MHGVKIHSTAEVSKKAVIGKGTCIWNQAQVREGAKIGSDCIISKNVYIDFDVKIGNNVKIQNNSSIYHGVTIEDGVFIGPHVCLTNDKKPRAINNDGSLRKSNDWIVSKTIIKKGASIGAGSIILPGIVIGEYAMIGAGSVVTKNVAPYTLAYGNPAVEKGNACICGEKLNNKIKCSHCGFKMKQHK
jgi:acetyltransferase-like isoleucine patch superfamily enzyme